MKVGFIGLGKLGLPCAEVIATKHNVTGFDILDVDTRSFPVVQNIKEAVVDKEIVLSDPNNKRLIILPMTDLILLALINHVILTIHKLSRY